MRTWLRSKFTLLFMTVALLAVPAVALADITLDTSATLATDANLPTSVEVGDNSFTIKVWRAGGNVGGSKTGEFSIVKQYNMAADGTITPDSTKVSNFDWSDLSCSGTTPPQGCTSTNPATITANLNVAAGAQGKTAQLQISQIAAAATTSGIVTDPTPASGYVKVAGKVAGSVSISNPPANAVFGGSFTPTYTKAGDGTASTTSKTTSVCSVNSSGVVSFDAAGTCTLQAAVAEGTNHLAATGAEQSFQIAKAAGSVSIGNPPANAVFGGSFTPTYTKAGDGATSVSSLTTSNCTVSNAGVVNYVGAGTCTLQAAVAEGTNHLAATGAEQSFQIAKADQEITFAPLANKTFGDPNFNVSATSDSGLTVSFAASGNCSIDANNDVTITGAGNCTITASQAGNNNYNAADPVPQSFQIAKATPTITWNPQAITYGTALGANQLNASASGVGGASLAGNFNYTPNTGTVLDAGSKTLSASFTPTNTTDYNSVPNAQATLTVNQAPLTVTGDNKSKYYGDANPQLTGTLTGVVNGDNITANYTTQAVLLSDAGTYPIVPQLVDPNNRLSNYSVNSTNGTLTVLSLSTKGFFAPVDMTTGPTIAWNTVKGGSTVPVKFELFKNLNDPSTELRDTSYVDKFAFNKVSCTAGADDAIEELTTATGQTTLRYDATGDQFVYNWATPKVSTTTCYKLTMYGADGASQISAYFKFNK